VTIEELAYRIEAGDVTEAIPRDAASLVLVLKNHRVTVAVTDIEERA